MKQLQSEMRQRTLGFITAAFGLVAGLAWNDAITALIEFMFPQDGGNTVTAKFVYAIIITLIVVVITVYLSRMFRGGGE